MLICNNNFKVFKCIFDFIHSINNLSWLTNIKERKIGSALPVLRTILDVFRPALIFHCLVIATNIPFHGKDSRSPKNCYEMLTFYLPKNKQHFRRICNKYFQINRRSALFSRELRVIKIHQTGINKNNPVQNIDNILFIFSC